MLKFIESELAEPECEFKLSDPRGFALGSYAMVLCLLLTIEL